MALTLAPMDATTVSVEFLGLFALSKSLNFEYQILPFYVDNVSGWLA